jgi:hypothetical protein
MKQIRLNKLELEAIILAIDCGIDYLVPTDPKDDILIQRLLKIKARLQKLK